MNGGNFAFSKANGNERIFKMTVEVSYSCAQDKGRRGERGFTKDDFFVK